jgi:glycosyltransferase involved in cell wall biosynthesis
MMSKKVLIVTDISPTQAGHGGGVVTWHEVNALRSAGALAGVIGKSPNVDKDNNPEKLGIPRHPFTIDFLTSTYLQDFMYDALFFNGNGFYNTARYAVDSLKDVERIPVIVDHPAHDLKESIAEFTNLGIKYPFTHMTDPFLLDKFLYPVKHADLVICPSEYSVTHTMDFGVPREKCVVIRHGCTPPTTTQQPDPEFKVINIGQLGPDKGHFYLWQAWGQLKQAGLKGKLILAGEGTAQIPTVFGQQPDAECLGYVDSNWRLEQKLWEASVYVQPSVTEGFGIPCLDAMSHARPVIVTNTTGSSELVEDGKSGFVVPPRDPKAIASKVQYFADNLGEVKRMGDAAREVAKQWTWERMEKDIAEKVLAL